MNLKSIALLAALVGGVFVSDARAQSYTGQIPSGNIYGNNTASAAKPAGSTVTSILDRALGSTRGAIIERGASGWAIVGPGSTAGLPFVSNGAGADPAFQALGFSGIASGALATAAQYISGASNVVVPASVIYTAETTTTCGCSTTTFDFSTFINTAITLTANITTMTLTNVKAGQAGTITFIQDGSGSRTTVWNSIFKFAGGTTPSLSTAPNAIDVLSYSCRSASFCVAALLQNVH